MHTGPVPPKVLACARGLRESGQFSRSHLQNVDVETRVGVAWPPAELFCARDHTPTRRQAGHSSRVVLKHKRHSSGFFDPLPACAEEDRGHSHRLLRR
jgi:hypothetical protein